MTALSSLTAPAPMRDTTIPPGSRTMQPRGASTNFFPGGLLAHRVGSDLVEHPSSAAPRTDLVAVGVFEANAVFTSGTTTDANGGALDANGYPQSLLVRSGIIGWFDTGSGAHQITNAMVDQVCYLFDNNTLYADNLNGTLSAAGYVAQVRADGKVKLRIDPSVYLTNQDALPQATQDDTANYVITSLPTGTWDSTGETFTVTATGAMPTQDTNITPAVGDKAIFPAGTLTTQAVTAAHSGVYVCVNPGGTGVQAVWQRTAKWAQGATITPGTAINVTGVNAASTTPAAQWSATRWTARPVSTGKIVGTDDPQLIPERVTVSVTLVSSTISITSVPIALNQKVDVSAYPTTVTGGTSTVGYGSIAAPTAGGVGTGTVVVDALAANQTKNGTGDTSTLNVTIIQ